MLTRLFSTKPQRRSALTASTLMILVLSFAASTVLSGTSTTNRNSEGQAAPNVLSPVTPPLPSEDHTEAVEPPSANSPGGKVENITAGFSASFFDGDIAEVILYKRNLSDQERLEVGNYLQAKYNLGGFATPAGPASPSGLVSSNPSSTSVTLSWNPSSGAAGIVGYQIYAGATLVASTAGTFYNLSNLAGGATYNFTVLAVDSLGRVSAPSASSPVTTTVPWPYASDPNGFADGDTIPNYEAVQIGTPQAHILTVTITAPANGSTVP